MIKDTLPVVHYYTQYDPYYFEVDNRPLRNLEARDLGLVEILTEWENFFETLVLDITNSIRDFVPVPGDPGDPGDPGPQGFPGKDGLDWKGNPGPPGANSTGGSSGQVLHTNLIYVGPINMVQSVYTLIPIIEEGNESWQIGGRFQIVGFQLSEQVADLPDQYVAVGMKSTSDNGPTYKHIYLIAAHL